VNWRLNSCCVGGRQQIFHLDLLSSSLKLRPRSRGGSGRADSVCPPGTPGSVGSKGHAWPRQGVMEHQPGFGTHATLPHYKSTVGKVSQQTLRHRSGSSPRFLSHDSWIAIRGNGRVASGLIRPHLPPALTDKFGRMGESDLEASFSGTRLTPLSSTTVNLPPSMSFACCRCVPHLHSE
jgi:hypothetical protein